MSHSANSVIWDAVIPRCKHFDDTELQMQCCIQAGHGPAYAVIRYGDEIEKDGHCYSPSHPPERTA